VVPVASWLQEQTADLALVGHLPFLDRLAALLIINDLDTSIVAFRNAALLRLARHQKRWRMEWNMWPE